MAKVTVKDNSASVKAKYDAAKKRSLESIGMTAEGFAKKELGRPKEHGDGSIKPNVVTAVLMNEITYKVLDNAVYVGTDTEYAPEVELGTRNARAYPFLVPAATQHTSTYNSIIESEFAKIRS